MSFQVGDDKQLPEYRVLTEVQRQDNTSEFSGCSLRYFLTFQTSTRLLKSSELQEVFPEKYYFKMRRLSAHTIDNLYEVTTQYANTGAFSEGSVCVVRLL